MLFYLVVGKTSKQLLGCTGKGWERTPNIDHKQEFAPNIINNGS